MEWTRRRLVGTTLAAAALAGCLGGDGSSAPNESGGDEEPDDGNGMADHDMDGDETDESDAAERALEDADLEDYTGRERVEVTVDPDGGGFEPEAFEIDADTFLEWTWEGSSVGLYPLDLPPECFWDEDADEDREWAAGDSYDRLFWAPGAYLYASRDESGEEFTGVFRVLETDEEDE